MLLRPFQIALILLNYCILQIEPFVRNGIGAADLRARQPYLRFMPLNDAAQFFDPQMQSARIDLAQDIAGADGLAFRDIHAQQRALGERIDQDHAFV